VYFTTLPTWDKQYKTYNQSKVKNEISRPIPNQSNVISTPTEASIEISRLLFQ
jgi:hypothetical protein